MNILVFVFLILSFLPTVQIHCMDDTQRPVDGDRLAQMEKDIITTYLDNNMKAAEKLIKENFKSGDFLLDYIIKLKSSHLYMNDHEPNKKSEWIQYLVENKLANLENVSALAHVCFGVVNKCCTPEHIKLLLDLGANPNIEIGNKDDASTIPLIFWAVKNNQYDIIIKLLNSPIINIDLAPNNLCILHKAGDSTAILFFVKKILPECKNIESCTDRWHDLIWAALNKFISKIPTINCNKPKEYNEFVALRSLLSNQYFDMHSAHVPSPHPVEQLLDLLPKTTEFGQTCIYRCLEILLSVRKEEDIPALNPFLPLPKKGCLLEYAIAQGDMRLFELCAKNRNFKAMVNYPLKNRADKATLLHLCAQHDFPDAIKIICKTCEAKLIEMRDEYDKTPLVYAKEKGHEKCVQELLNHRCNPNPSGAACDIDGSAYTISLIDKKPYNQEAQGSSTIATLPLELLPIIFAHVADGGSLKRRMLSLIHGPMRVNKTWRHILHITPSNLPECAVAFAPHLTTQEVNQEVNSILYGLILDKSRSQNDRIAMFKYLVSRDINSIKSPKYSLLNRALEERNIEWVKTIIYWYEKYDEKQLKTDPKHIPLINQPSCWIWNCESCTPVIREHNQGMPSLGFALFMLKDAHHQPQIQANANMKNDTLDCIEYLLEHGADPKITIPIENSGAYNNLQSLAVIAILEDLEYTLPLFIKYRKHNVHGVDVNQIYNTTGNNTHHTLLTLATRIKKPKAIQELLKINGLEINKLVNNMTALDIAYMERKENHAIIKSLQDADAKRARQLAANNNSSATPQAHAQSTAPVVNVADALQTTATTPSTSITTTNTPGTTVAPSQHQATTQSAPISQSAPAPVPVPGNNPQSISHHWMGQKPLAWIAGLSLGAVSIYAVCKYFWAEQDDVDEDEQEESEELYA